MRHNGANAANRLITIDEFVVIGLLGRELEP
jgi:hypothetical protein